MQRIDLKIELANVKEKVKPNGKKNRVMKPLRFRDVENLICILTQNFQDKSVTRESNIKCNERNNSWSSTLKKCDVLMCGGKMVGGNLI